MRLLDTNICIAYLNGTDPRVRDKLLALAPSEVCLCSVVKAELLFGARKSAKVKDNLEKLKAFFVPFDSLLFDDRAAEQYGVIRAQLERDGTPIGTNDMLITSIAMAQDAELVTRNQDEFTRIAGLRVDTW
ncbi:MAG: type II toxin-antitoxin system VapC family toxin [Sandaracinaceae bacterium]|nr:type II toxin-antitoxin system VapC family toxin [Sandaracinaceae bacterium]